jgi:hypothetical protein
MTLTALADRMTLANLSIFETGKARAIRFLMLERQSQRTSSDGRCRRRTNSRPGVPAS